MYESSACRMVLFEVLCGIQLYSLKVPSIHFKKIIVGKSIPSVIVDSMEHRTVSKAPILLSTGLMR
jgi:hypothetical protein